MPWSLASNNAADNLESMGDSDLAVNVPVMVTLPRRGTHVTSDALAPCGDTVSICADRLDPLEQPPTTVPTTRATPEMRSALRTHTSSHEGTAAFRWHPEASGPSEGDP